MPCGSDGVSVMSRVGRKSIEVPAGVTVGVEGRVVSVKGPRGELIRELPPGTSAAVSEGTLSVSRADDARVSRSIHGLARSLLANMVEGVSRGYSRQIEVEGVGFRAVVQGGKLVLNLGFSAPIEYAIPEEIAVSVDGGTKIVVSGVDKQRVGCAAARIRSFFPAEPYKGKGIHYKGEHVRRKVGKTVA